MKKILSIVAVLTLLMVCFTGSESTGGEIDVAFCDKGTGGVCVERVDGFGFDCNPNGKGNIKCGGTHIQTIKTVL